jgi:hypothetical protein
MNIGFGLPSTTCPDKQPLITILKTLVKRCILIMSRHRFVRNLDLDGIYFPYSLRQITHAHLLQKSARMALCPTVEMI